MLNAQDEQRIHAYRPAHLFPRSSQNMHHQLRSFFIDAPGVTKNNVEYLLLHPRHVIGGVQGICGHAEQELSQQFLYK
jgi:hypothetical protein